MSLEIIVPIICLLVCAACTVYSAINWRGDKYLCDTCRFNSEELCQKEKRPKAVQCLAFLPGATAPTESPINTGFIGTNSSEQ